jgi:DUF1365 family protein
MRSCLYEGRIAHERCHPVRHRFTYPLYFGYLDLDELPYLLGKRGLISTRRFAATSFSSANVGWQPGLDLAEQARRYLAQHTGIDFDGRVRVLTPFRHFGHYFSPLNLYYCFERDGKMLRSVVAEVSNTPWGERHWYVLDGKSATDCETVRCEHDKQFHVSPFMPMDLQYKWKFDVPNDSLSVHVDCLEDAKRLFRAHLSLRRQPLDGAHLRRLSLRYPLATGRTVAAIYFQALRLWLKRCPFYPHPQKTLTTETRQAGPVGR